MKKHIVTVIASAAVVSSVFLLHPATKTKTVEVHKKGPQYHGIVVKNCFAHDDCYK